MAKITDIIFDCVHAASLARFWEAALDDYAIAPYDDDEVARLAALGIFDLDDDPTVLLQPTSGGPRVWFQTVPEPKATKNRMHLDLIAEDPDAEIGRLISLGARRAASQPSADVIVMYDPQGNEFCVIRPSSS